MNIKIQGGGKDLGIHANKGSCINLVNYLQHEDKERAEFGMNVYPFFSSAGEPVKAQDVLSAIDGNHAGLHKDDAKFYMLTISPSKEEILAMGKTEKEQVESAKEYVRKVLDAYANNFHRENITGYSDIMYFYKLHFTRAKDAHLEFHIQGVLSRKDVSGKYKLSPMTNHRNTQSGAVRGGFDRMEFDRRCEKLFDETFTYKRGLKESFDYCNTVKNGTPEEIFETHRQKYEEQHPNYRERNIHYLQAKMETVRQRKKDKFWNEYHSHYKPLFDKFKEQIDASEQLFSEVSEKYKIATSEISGKYAEMKGYYEKMKDCTKIMKESRTASGLVKAGVVLLSYSNPAAAVTIGMLSLMVIEARRRIAVQERRALLRKIDSIQRELKKWKDYRDDLLTREADISEEIKTALADRRDLSSQLNTLRKQLDESMPKEDILIWQTPGQISLLSTKVTQREGECVFWKAAWEHNGDTRKLVWQKVDSFASAKFLCEKYDYAYFKVTDKSGNEKIVNQYACQVNMNRKQGMSR